ncbi:hypothetical protein CDAR_173411 [Caerostris darwini]|uniref:Uncharacterized protein n=1 Tax=Caerostris darwini TaxID=1538125 RepID=A0AAV4SQ76_9ARAC|nr:hypothetical protein CDAR_173411 [Caerostris darwini]
MCLERNLSSCTLSPSFITYERRINYFALFRMQILVYIPFEITTKSSWNFQIVNVSISKCCKGLTDFEQKSKSSRMSFISEWYTRTREKGFTKFKVLETPLVCLDNDE